MCYNITQVSQVIISLKILVFWGKRLYSEGKGRGKGDVLQGKMLRRRMVIKVFWLEGEWEGLQGWKEGRKKWISEGKGRACFLGV